MSRSSEDRSPLSVGTEIDIHPEDTTGLWEAMREKLDYIAAVRAGVLEAYKGIFLNDDYERNIATTKAAIDRLRPQMCVAVRPCREDMPGSMTACGSRLRIDHYALVGHLGDPHTTEQEWEALDSALAELKLLFDEPEDIVRLAAAWSCAHNVSEAKIATYLHGAENPPFRELDAEVLAALGQTELDFHDCMEAMGYWLLALEEAEKDTIGALELQEIYEDSKDIITNAFEAAGLEELT
ncbi:hypothetical protein DL764_000104 [Monosporascus ibericus]|uniref:Uncharacterized protein n=1 Tax=Monosporascus ibericus TaxID=155417 RepID=A0A4Q4TUQ8_9PEZI|nr:hypothetical protein DL764_000104 [Monosporascus ibericus]